MSLAVAQKQGGVRGPQVVQPELRRCAVGKRLTAPGLGRLEGAAEPLARGLAVSVGPSDN
jgi:hypothetical protein